MAVSCFCGCGREIKGMRRRATDLTGREVDENVRVLAASLDDVSGEEGAALEDAVAEGRRLLANLTALQHDEIGRGDFDKKALTSWLATAKKLRTSLPPAGGGAAWKPGDPGDDVLAATGIRARGVIVAVEKKGLGNERVASLEMTVAVRDAEGAERRLTRRVAIAVYEAPRVGDRVEVAYDPADPDRFVYRPDLELP